MEDLTGRQFGPYQIVAPLGEGGMAAVYKAYQPSMERYVALKVLPRHFTHDPQFQARFRRESKLLAQLQHPYILPVFDSGQADGYSYIVMPFVQGGTLADALDDTPISLQRIRQVLTQVGSALHYAHERGMIHRDVKPSNILIDETGNCLLTDFGVARIVEASVSLTGSGTVIGTPAYMSPEQGSGKKVDERSDIYSLGIILYEMATGRVPYKAETPIAVIFKHIQDPLPPARGLNPELPEALNLVILKALAKRPEDRYQTAEEMVQAIRAAIPETDVRQALGRLPGDPAAPYDRPTAMGRASTAEKWSSGFPVWAWGLIGAIILALVGVLSSALGVGFPVSFIGAPGTSPTSLAPASSAAPPMAGAATIAPSGNPPSAQPSGGPIEVDCKGASPGDSLAILHPWEAEGAAKFEEITRPLADLCGLDVNLTTIEDPETLSLTLQTASPDILIWSSTKPLRLAGTDFIDLKTLGAKSENYRGDWLELGRIDGRWRAMPVKADLKSLVWYRPVRFSAYDYEPPTTFDQLVSLVNQMVSDGKVPWSMGLESGAASGWTASDFIQDLLLVDQGPDYVIGIINGTVPYDDPGVVHAYQTYLNWATDQRYAFGGSDGALNTSFMDSLFSVFNAVPYAMMVREAGWAGGEIASRMPSFSYGIDYDFFVFPGIKGVQGGADYLMALRDTPATRAMVGYLSSPAGARAWARAGFGLSPNNLASGHYTDPQLAKRAEILSRADAFTPDLGDTLASPFASVEWAAIIDVLRGEDLQTALSRVAEAQRQAVLR